MLRVAPYFLRLAGADPLPKRTLPESCVAVSAVRSTRGALPDPKRTRRGSAIFFEAGRTERCFFVDMRFLLERVVVNGLR